MSELIPPPAWMARGICAQTDPDAFFPAKGGPVAAAKAVCNGNAERGIRPCPVRAQCLAYALEHDERGVWGGLSERERRAIRDAREREVPDAA